MKVCDMCGCDTPDDDILGDGICVECVDELAQEEDIHREEAHEAAKLEEED